VLGGVVRAKLARDAGGESTRWTCRLCDLHACGRAEGTCPAAKAAAGSASASASRG
jgi:hypothetical protein